MISLQDPIRHLTVEFESVLLDGQLPDLLPRVKVKASNKQHQHGDRNVFESTVLHVPSNNAATLLSFHTSDVKWIRNVPFCIREAFWYDFDSANNKPSICLVGTEHLEVHNGFEFLSQTLPFKVKSAWSTAFGILFERLVDTNLDEEIVFPLMFTLSHPLSELYPVVYRPSGLLFYRFAARLIQIGVTNNAHNITCNGGGNSKNQAWYMMNRSQIIVGSFEKPSLIVMLDVDKNCISIWRVKSASDEEGQFACVQLEQSFRTPEVNNTGRSSNFLSSLIISQSKRTPYFSRQAGIGGDSGLDNDTPSGPSCIGTSASGTQSSSQLRTSSYNSSSQPGTTSISELGVSKLLHGRSSFLSSSSQLASSSNNGSSLAQQQLLSSINSQSTPATERKLPQVSPLIVKRQNFLARSVLIGSPLATATPGSMSKTVTQRASNLNIAASVMNFQSPVGSRLTNRIHNFQVVDALSPITAGFMSPMEASLASVTPLGGQYSGAVVTTEQTNIHHQQEPNRPSRRRIRSKIQTNSNQHELSSRSSIITEPSLFDNSYACWAAEPLVPDVCLEQIWTEPMSKEKRCVLTPDEVTCFTTEDFVGQQYLCIMQYESKSLLMLKISMGNDNEQIIFGTVSQLHNVKDFVNFRNHNVFVVLDCVEGLVLYTGKTKIAFIHLNLAAVVQENGDFSINNTTFDVCSSRKTNDESPKYLTSSRCPSSTALDMSMDSSDMLSSPLILSPVSQANTSARNTEARVDSLGLSVDRIFELKLTSNVEIRSQIPSLAQSELVMRSLDAICSVLPRDISLNFKSQWYLANNTLSTKLNTELERFWMFLFESVGFSVADMTIFRDIGIFQNDSSEIHVTKRARIGSGVESDLDWNYLTGTSLYGAVKTKLGPPSHHTSRHQVDGLSPLARKKSPRKFKEHVVPDDVTLSTTGILFAHCPSVLVVLHLIYEDLKLNSTTCLEALNYFAKFLAILASTLPDSDAYCEIYMRDFNTHSIVTQNRCSIRKTDLKKMSFPAFWSPTSLNMFEWVESAMKSFPTNSDNFIVSKLPVPFLPGISSRTVDVVILTLLACGFQFTDKLTVGNILKSIPLVRTIGASVAKYRLAYEKSSEILSNLTVTFTELAKQSDKSAGVLVLQYLEKEALSFQRGDNMEQRLMQLPAGFAIFLLDRVYAVKHSLESLFSKNTDFDVFLARRNDKLLSKMCQTGNKEMDTVGDVWKNPLCAKIFEARYSKDLRVFEVCRMLNSSRAVKIALQQQPSVSDHDFREEQERLLYAMCNRTMALPIARGIFTYATKSPMITEMINVPTLNLTGKGLRNLTIELNRIDLPSNMELWAQFHNGVAAALELTPASLSTSLSSSWLSYNLPKPDGLTTEQSGILLGLGLQGHLSNVGLFNFHEYLSKAEPLSSIALLLGISASRYGTSELSVMKMLSIHLPFLLPPTVLELNIDPLVQTAAVTGLGLLYAESRNILLIESLLDQIGSLPVIETETLASNSLGMGNGLTDREAYALSCGWALGLMNLGQGNICFSSVANTDAEPSLADRLKIYLLGGRRRRKQTNRNTMYASDGSSSTRLIGSTRMPPVQQRGGVSLATQCSLVKEGDLVNVDVTGPAAAMSLALIFLKTNEDEIAEWMSPPDTLELLDGVRPDLLLLRTLSKSMILWDKVAPSQEWIESQLPDVILRCVQASSTVFNLSEATGATERRAHCRLIESLNGPDSGRHWNLPPLESIDWITVSQAYCNIVAAACLALGFRFAGSANDQAFKLILSYAKMFVGRQKLFDTHISPILEQAGKFTVGECLNAVLLSLGLLMAGTGNVDVMRIVIYVRKSIASEQRQPRTGSDAKHFSSHLAAHLTLALLFMGGGRHCLSTDNKSIAVMLLAFYPRMPTSSNDNRCHLQALRHMYVLATEPRFIIPVNVGTAEYDNVQLLLKLKDTVNYSDVMFSMKAPCMLPELNLLQSVTVKDERYCEQSFHFNNAEQWRKLETILRSDAILSVIRRPGYSSHLDDPNGYKSLSNRFIFGAKQENAVGWRVSNDHLSHLKFNSKLKFNLASSSSVSNTVFNTNMGSLNSQRYSSLQLYCTVNEASVACSFLQELDLATKLSSSSSLKIWQCKLAKAHGKTRKENEWSVLNLEFLQNVELVLAEKLLNAVTCEDLQRYWGLSIGEHPPFSQHFAEFLTYFDIPKKSKVLKAKINIEDCTNLQVLIQKLLSCGTSIETVLICYKLFN